MSRASAAILRAVGEDTSYRIDSHSVPRIHEKEYESYTERLADEEVLVEWLRQQGFTDAEIGSAPPSVWSRLKVERIDHGLGVPRSGLDGIPDTDEEWSAMAEGYGLTKTQIPDFRAIWESMGDDIPLTENSPGFTMRQINKGGMEVSAVFDQYARVYTRIEARQGEYDLIHQDMTNAKGRMSAQPIADDALRTVQRYVESRFGAKKAPNIKTLSDVDTYITIEQFRQGVPSAPLDLGTADTDGLTKATVDLSSGDILYTDLSKTDMARVDRSQFLARQRASLDDYEAQLASQEQKTLLDLGWEKGVTEGMTRASINLDEWHLPIQVSDANVAEMVQMGERAGLPEVRESVRIPDPDLVMGRTVIMPFEDMEADQLEELIRHVVWENDGFSNRQLIAELQGWNPAEVDARTVREYNQTFDDAWGDTIRTFDRERELGVAAGLLEQEPAQDNPAEQRPIPPDQAEPVRYDPVEPALDDPSGASRAYLLEKKQELLAELAGETDPYGWRATQIRTEIEGYDRVLKVPVVDEDVASFLQAEFGVSSADAQAAWGNVDPDELAAQSEVRRDQFMSEEELRELIWQNPDATDRELIAQLQNWPLDQVDSRTQKIYSQSFDDAWGHVTEIFDQERELGQALDILHDHVPYRTVDNLASRIRSASSTIDPYEQSVFDGIIANYKGTTPGGVEMQSISQGVWGPQPLEPEFVDVSDVGGPLEGTDRIMVYNAPDGFDPQAIHDEMLAAREQGTLERWFTTTPGGNLTMEFGGMLFGIGVGVAIGQALSKQTMFWVGIGSMLADPIGGAFGVLPLFGSSLLDYGDRMHRSHFSEDQHKGQLAFVRQGDKLIPALVKSFGESKQFESPVDFTGELWTWQGAKRVRLQTGYGISMDGNGNLTWLNPGPTRDVIMRQEDLNWDSTSWKPWNNVFLVDPDDFQKYAETGLFGPIPAPPMDKIYDDLDSSETFKALIELSHAAWNLGLQDPAYMAHWDAQKETLVPTNPQMGAFDPDKGRGEFYLWHDLSVADQIGWLLNDKNPDNWWQVHSSWDRAHPSTDYIHDQAQIYRERLQKEYAALDEETKAELGTTTIQAVPETAVELDQTVQQIRSNGTLSWKAKEYRIQQEGARFWLKHTGRAAGFREDYFGGYYADVLGEDLMQEFHENAEQYSQLHPELYTSTQSMYESVFDQGNHTNEDALGFKRMTDIIGEMPVLSSQAANAVMSAHHNWPMPSIPAPTTKHEDHTGPDPRAARDDYEAAVTAQ